MHSSKRNEDRVARKLTSLLSEEFGGFTRHTFVVRRPELDVRVIREKVGMGQAEFARAFAIPLNTLKAWEKGSRNPDRTAQAYLKVIKHAPEAVRESLAKEQPEVSLVEEVGA